MVPEKCTECNAQKKHNCQYRKFKRPTTKKVLKDNEIVGLDMLPRGTIKEREFQQFLVHHFSLKEHNCNRTTVGTHDNMNGKKQQEPPIVVLSDCIEDPSTKMVITRYILVILQAVKFAPGELDKISGITSSVRNE